MKHLNSKLLISIIILSLATLAHAAEIKVGPKEGSKMEDFVGTTINGESFQLSKLFEKGSVVLVMLRGFPGYQCPICSRQVGSYISHAKDFAAGDATVLLVYPGSGEDLNQRAKEFLKNATLPVPFTLLLDPDYKFTNAYGLRWDAPRETAYPSTFVIDSTSKVRYAKISQTHGGRADVADVIAALKETK